jgi:predicted DCC family thiol-disulfide oxidoreductase YuxK
LSQQEQHIVFFDGVCNLCNSSVQLIIRNDKKARFKFASLQSKKARELLKHFGGIKEDSVLYLKDGILYRRSSAALRIAKELDDLWPLFFVFIIIPPFIRDAVYNWVAKNRYRWFGKMDNCMIPEEGLKERFID